MGSTTRTRVENLLDTKSEWGIVWPSLPAFTQRHSATVSITGTQKTVSEGHPFGGLGRVDADLGGEFYTSRYRVSSNSPYIDVKMPLGAYSKYYRGKLRLAIDNQLVDSLASLEPSSNSVLDALGTTAIAQTLPTNPVAGLSVTFGELREGFPRLIGSLAFRNGIKDLLRGSGDEFLNYEFGIKPLINDLLKWGKAHTQADRIWKQFLRDSGKRIRRHYTFPISREVLQDDVLANATVFPVSIGAEPELWQGGQNTYPMSRNYILERRRWFSGCFTYFAEFDKSQQGEWDAHQRRLDLLYGTKVTPETIWNLAPWSWAADWFANTGSLITNLTRFSEDGLVMPYGYMMEHSIRTNTYGMRNLKPLGYQIPSLTQTITHTVKVRRRATPFGFGLNDSSFTNRQWAIIGALGLSRL